MSYEDTHLVIHAHPDAKPVCDALRKDWGSVKTAIRIADVDCEDCLNEEIKQAALTLSQEREAGDELTSDTALDERLKEAVVRLGEIHLKLHHPSVYEEMMRERARPAEPMDLLAIVNDARNVQWIRWAYDTHTHSPWQEVGAVHIGTEDDGSDHKSWEEIDAAHVMFPGIPDDVRFPK